MGDTRDVGQGGGYERDENYLTTRVTRDGADGYPVEAGRYRLIAARACPWANRSIIVRRLLGAVDHPVSRLVRTQIGDVKLGHQRPGTLRKLNPVEIAQLYKAVGL